MADFYPDRAKKRQQSHTTQEASPLQPRPSIVQTRPQPTPSISKEELWADYQQAKQLGHQMENIAILAPDRVSSPPIQAKLTISQPGDKYEQEADRMASQVMSTSDRTLQREETPQAEEENLQLKSLANQITPLVQREEEKEEEENLQMKPVGNFAIQREELPEEEPEEIVQAKSSLPMVNDGGLAASNDIASKLHSRRGEGNPLADDVRSFMEPRFRVDFSHVKVHTDGEAVQMTKDVGAQAFTYGSDVYFGAGKLPGNNELTAHELTHVVQQVSTQTGIVQKKPSSSPPKKRIEVDLSSQNLYAFEKDKHEKYKQIYSFNCVSGDRSHPTPVGNFSILTKHKNYTSKKYGAPMNYAMFFTRTGEAIHQGLGVGPSSYLKSWRLDSIGSYSIGSHGCVRLAKDHAATLFQWTPMYTPVWVH